MINWFCHMYPYGNLHELNLDWVIDTVKKGEKEIADFIGVNTIKYANPILWNITSQYEANTVVVDGQTGNAYISVKAVPSGVHLNRDEYWTQIYNYADVVDTLREQIAYNEGENTTATRPYSVNDLVFVNGNLYRVIHSMIAGDSFVVDSNVVDTTINVELGRLREDIEDEATTRENADDTLQGNIEAEANARENADDTLQGNIEAEASARESADDTLQGNIEAEASTRESADDELLNLITSIHMSIPSILDFGVENNGTTDNTNALNSLNSGIYYLPNGTYLYSDIVELENITLIGESVDGVIFENVASESIQEIHVTDSVLYNITFNDNSTIVNNSAVIRLLGNNSVVSKCKINLSNEGHIGVSVNTKGLIDNCVINGNTTALFGIYANTNTTSVKVTNSEIYGFWLNGIYTESKKLSVDNVHLHDNHYQVTPNGGGQICVTGESAGVATYNISNCFIESPSGTSTYAIETFNATGIITSNLLQGNTTAPTIRIQQSANDCIIGNTIMGGSRGIEIVGGATRKASTLIEGNTFANTIVCVYCADLVNGVVAIGNNTNNIPFYGGNSFKAFLNYQTNGSTLISNTTTNVATIDIPFDITRIGGGVMVDLTVYCNGQFYPILGRLTNAGFVPFIPSSTIGVSLSGTTLTITGVGSYIEVWYRFY